MKITDNVKDNLKDYAAEVILRRALVNVADGLKPSARQIFYALHTDKITYNKKYTSTPKLIASGFRFYTKGDASLQGILMRSGQNFNMRYPLMDISGQGGTLIKTADWAAPRYTKGRLSEISSYMFKGIEKDTIEKWYDNYDDTEKFPAVLPCLGFWPLINGSMGIGVALAASIPSFNLKEMNLALIDCLWDRSFEIPMPDFPNGGIIVNETEVKASLLAGTGRGINLRSKIEYNSKEHYLLATEIPPLTYVNTIVKELEEMMEDEQCGIDRFTDRTGEAAEIKIFLSKNAQPQEVIARLYKETSLQNFYGINMTMLDGSKPKVFGLIEAMKKHLEHEIKCYTRAFQFDLRKLEDRKHILEGYIIASNNIEEVIKMIKASKTSSDAKLSLMDSFELTEVQATAVLKLTLSRIAALEVQKFTSEKEKVISEIDRINQILKDESLLKREVESGLREVIAKFSDIRRTKVLNVTDEEDSRIIYFTKSGKASIGKPKNETVMATIMSGTPYLAVTKKGIVYRSNEVPKRMKTMFSIDKDDEIIAIQPAHEGDYLVTYSQDKSFRCQQVSALNKKRTTLSNKNLTDAFVTSEKITKSEYKKR